MRREVFISLPAQAAFNDAQDWLTQPGSGPIAWRKWLDLRDAPDALAAFPHRGPEVPNLTGFRQLVVSGYRIIYRVHPDTGDRTTAGDVFITAVFSPGTP